MCTPLVSRSNGRRPGRMPAVVRSSQGPVAFTVKRAWAWTSRPLSESRTTAPADTAVLVSEKSRGRCAGQDQTARARRVQCVFDDQPFDQRDLAVVEAPGALQALRLEPGLDAQQLTFVQPLARGQALVERQRVVQLHAGLQLGAVEHAAAVHRHQELQRLHQVGRQAQQDLAFAHVRAHQSEVEHFEVAQPTMDEARRPRRGARGEVVLFDQRYLESAQSQVAGNARAHDAATDDQHVERSALERLEIRFRRSQRVHVCRPEGVR